MNRTVYFDWICILMNCSIIIRVFRLFLKFNKLFWINLFGRMIIQRLNYCCVFFRGRGMSAKRDLFQSSFCHIWMHENRPNQSLHLNHRRQIKVFQYRFTSYLMRLLYIKSIWKTTNGIISEYTYEKEKWNTPLFCLWARTGAHSFFRQESNQERVYIYILRSR